jgi:hypothetical protein
MIVERCGRYYTSDEPDDDDRALRDAVGGLSPEERGMLERILSDEAGLASLNEIIEQDYDIVPPTPEQWLTDPFFGAAIAKDLYPRVRKEFLRIHSGRYSEIFLTGALGWGKTYLTAISIAYDLTCMLCLKNPQQSYGLGSDTPIVFFAFSTTLNQAGKGIGHDVVNVLKKSPFFTERFKPSTKLENFSGTEVKFPKDVFLVLSTEGSARTLGTNAIGGGIDESDFQGKVKQSKTTGATIDKDKALVVYESAKRRAKSRFNARGRLPAKLYIVSSKTTRRSMLVTKVNDKIRRGSRDTLVLDFATYMVKDPSKFLPTSFQVFIGTEGTPPEIIRDAAHLASLPEEYQELLETVPDDFRDDFEDDTAAALADIAGIAVGAFGRFYKRQDRIDDIIDEARPNPFSRAEWVCGGDGQFRWDVLCNARQVRMPGGVLETTWSPKRNPDAVRIAHIDTSVTDCATSLTVAHVSRMCEVTRRRYVDGGRFERYTEYVPFIDIDLVLRILPPPGDEIDFSLVRGLVYDLIGHGFNITQLSTDSYQSIETQQQFRRHGIVTKTISTDRTPVAHLSLRQAINEGRVTCHPHPILVVELKHLELQEVTPGRLKVVKPSKFDDGGQASKDCADGVACVILAIESDPPAQRPVAPPQKGFDQDENWLFGNSRPVAPDFPEWGD